MFPPEDCCGNYDNKCFISFNKLKCYDSNFKEVGEDAESAKALFDELRMNNALCHEVAEIAEPNVQKMRRCCSGKKALEKINSKLQEFINGVGWGCSLDSYI